MNHDLCMIVSNFMKAIPQNGDFDSLDTQMQVSVNNGHEQNIVFLKVGTHLATSCSNTSRRQIIPCEQVGLLVAATQCGDTSQRQIASCVQKFCENLCLRNRILSLQQVAKNQIRLNLCDLLRRQNSFAATKIFTKILQYGRSDLSLLMCHRDVLVQLVAQCVPTTRLFEFILFFNI